MVKVFGANGGRFEIRDTSGNLTVHSGERLFMASNFVTGSVVRPARSTSYFSNASGQQQSTPIDVTEVVDLADVHASAVAVIGSFKVTGALAVPGAGTIAGAANGVRNYGWFTAGGTYVHAILPRWTYTGAWSRGPMGLFSQYTFTAGGGKLRLNERTVGDAGIVANPYYGSINLSQEQITIDYKLFVGTYV